MEQQTQVSVPQVDASIVVDHEVIAKVDALGALGEELVAAKKLVAKYDKLRKEIVSQVEVDLAPESATVLVGNEFIVKLTAKQNKRLVIDKQVIYEAVGNDTFVELATFSLGDLDKYLSPAQLEKAVAESAAGARKVTTAKRTVDIVA